MEDGTEAVITTLTARKEMNFFSRFPKQPFCKQSVTAPVVVVPEVPEVVE